MAEGPNVMVGAAPNASVDNATVSVLLRMKEVFMIVGQRMEDAAVCCQP